MEGVVMVEMSSGALQYTQSFTDAFDVRHPKTERLNLGALIFALQNFAGSSMRPTDNNNEGATAKERRSGVGAEISMFATPMENMVLATTPSQKIIVVLFTTPEFDVDVAKWLVGRVAFNYENYDNTEMQLTTALNQVPRRFRLAFSQAVDETVDQELIQLSENILLSPERKSEDCDAMQGEGELFLFFYYSARLNGSNDVDSDNEPEKRVGPTRAMNPDDRQDVRAANTTLSVIARRRSLSASVRNMMSSTRAIVATPINHAKTKNKKPRKKTRWGARNAVMHHTEPNEFQRVIEVHSHDRKATLMEPHRTDRAYGVADVLLPSVELSRILLFAADSPMIPNTKMTIQRPQKLDQLVWKNTPGVASSHKPQGGTDMIAWRSGPCCIFYPLTAVSTNPEIKPRVRLAVAALFDVLNPIFAAKSTILV